MAGVELVRWPEHDFKGTTHRATRTFWSPLARAGVFSHVRVTLKYTSGNHSALPFRPSEHQHTGTQKGSDWGPLLAVAEGACCVATLGATVSGLVLSSPLFVCIGM